MASANEILTLLMAAIGSGDSDKARTDSTATEVQATGSDTGRITADMQELYELLSMASVSTATTVHAALEKAGEAQTQFENAKEQLSAVVGILANAVESLKQAQTHMQSIASLSGQPGTPIPTWNPAPSRAPPLPIPASYPRPEHIPEMGWSAFMHIVQGDHLNRSSGGHGHGINRPKKTEFPPEWEDERIIAAVTVVARYPEWAKRGKYEREWYAEGVYRGVRVAAITQPSGDIIAGWPIEGPGVSRNQ